jgi:hypothetical protein
MKNLFSSTRRLAKGAEEDHLTAFFAAALDIDERFREAYESIVIAPFAEKRGWANARIRQVETQEQFEFKGQKSRPDMTLRLTDGHIIICEHKLEASQTLAPVSLENDEFAPVAGEQLEQGKAQLQRYLELPVDGLVFIRASMKPIEQDVLEHTRYVRPSFRQHFLWRDFYLPLVNHSSHPYGWCLREGFEDLGFTPPHPFVGDLAQPENRQNFAKLWDRTRSRAQGLGWHVGAGAVVELYLNRPEADMVSQIWLCPRNEQLLIRATPASESRLLEIERRLQLAATGFALEVNVKRRTLKRTKGSATVVDVWAPLGQVLSDSDTAEQTETRLFEFVEPFLCAVSVP